MRLTAEQALPSTDNYIEKHRADDEFKNFRNKVYGTTCGQETQFLLEIIVLFLLILSTSASNNNMSGTGTFRPVNDGRDEDLLIISTWVRKELFNQVKFLYRAEEDLAVDGHIYRKFLLDCKDRLVGLKIREGEPNEYRHRYCQSLWNHATRKKTNLVTRGINARRSSIYSGTQNRFHGK